MKGRKCPHKSVSGQRKDESVERVLGWWTKAIQPLKHFASVTHGIHEATSSPRGPQQVKDMAVHGQDVAKLRDTQHLYEEHSYDAHRWETRDTGEGNEMSEYWLFTTDGPHFQVNLDQSVSLGSSSSSTFSRKETLGISGMGFLWGVFPVTQPSVSKHWLEHKARPHPFFIHN